MIAFINAKLNFGLNIIRRRDDGYHELETLFYPVGLYNGTPENPEPFCDILEITSVPEEVNDNFRFTGRLIDCPKEKNLVYRSVSLFRERMRENGKNPGGFAIWLDKHIPDGAGLGGGSADASFTLKILNTLTGTPFTREELIEMASRLGADCPFFIENRPVYASGIGEVMTSAPVSLEGYWAVVIKPEISISTKEAFGGITPRIPKKSIREITSLPPEKWMEAGLSNDFEESVFPEYPQLRELKEMLLSMGAVYSAMSGSGSSIFGIFPHRQSARKSWNVCTSSGLSTFLCRL